VHLRAEDITHDVIDAALSKPPVDDLALVVYRARALQAFLKTPDGENLVQGYRRAANILTQAEEKDGVEYRFGADPKFAETDEERALFAALDTATADRTGAGGRGFRCRDVAHGRPSRAHRRVFRGVQVNADNQIVRRNRLNLLHQIVETCGQVADLASSRADPAHPWRDCNVPTRAAAPCPPNWTGRLSVVSYAATANTRAFRTA
jgi:glycyl-tRNA synthetase beta chain